MSEPEHPEMLAWDFLGERTGFLEFYWVWLGFEGGLAHLVRLNKGVFLSGTANVVPSRMR